MIIKYNGKTIETTRRDRVHKACNQFKHNHSKKRNIGGYIFTFIVIMQIMAAGYLKSLPPFEMLSPIAYAEETAGESAVLVATESAQLVEKEPSELEKIIAYIVRTYENEGKDDADSKRIVLNAINCFYSESGLQEKIVGQNTDKHLSKDHGVAQLNDYWHKLSEAEKTEYKANIDRSLKIFKGRGGNFSAWYGKLCN